MTMAFLLVIIGITGLVFFGLYVLGNMTKASEIADEDIEIINTIDVTHILLSCLEKKGDIDESLLQSSISPFCRTFHPGLGDFDYEYLVEDAETGKDFYDSGFDSNSVSARHSISFNYISNEGEIRIGRLYVQAD